MGQSEFLRLGCVRNAAGDSNSCRNLGSAVHPEIADEPLNHNRSHAARRHNPPSRGQNKNKKLLGIVVVKKSKCDDSGAKPTSRDRKRALLEKALPTYAASVLHGLC